MPLPAASAYAMASSLVDIPAGRSAGVFVVDNTETRFDGALPPSCIAFESQRCADPLGSEVAPLISLFIIGHGLGDRTNANLTLTTAAAAGALLVNGYGTPLPLLVTPNPDGSVNVSLSVAPLPQYLLLGGGCSTSAVAACSSLIWNVQ